MNAWEHLDTARDRALAHASETLLAALWREHPAVLRRLAHDHHANGTGTVRLPKGD